MHNQFTKTPLRYSLSVVCIFICSLGFSQITIDKIEFDNREVANTEIRVKKPDQEIQNLSISKSSEFSSGTLFEIPSKTVIYLKTPGGNTQRLGPGSKHQVIADRQSESHRTFWGKVTHFVKNKLNFYKASGPTDKYQAAVEGTVFSVTVIDKNIEFNTTEGKVEIGERIPIEIEDKDTKGGTKTLSLFETSKIIAEQGDIETYDLKKENTKKIRSYKKALRKYRKKYRSEQNSDNCFIVGRLYLLLKDYDQATTYLELAYNHSLDERIPNYDINLSLIEAYYESGYLDAAYYWLDETKEFILEEFLFLQESFDHYKQEQDDQSTWSFGVGLVDVYQKLGKFEEFYLELKDYNAERDDDRIQYFQSPDYMQIKVDPQFWYQEADKLKSFLDTI